MVAEDEVPATEANALTGGSVDPDIRTDIETDDRFHQPKDGNDGEQPGTTDEVADATQTATSGVYRKVLNSKKARQFKTQFRRRTDSEIVNIASVEGDYVLMLDSESSGDWMKHVPAERRAVLKQQRLWRIPDNWEHFVRIANDHSPDEILYHIPESGVYVVVVDLEQKDGARSGYRVDTIGKLVIEITDMPDKMALIEVLERIDDGEADDVSAEVRDALRLLLDRWLSFERAYLSYYKKWSDKRAWNEFKADRDVTFDAWSIDPWEQQQNIGHLIEKVCHSRVEVSTSVNELLMEADVVSPSPTVTITIQETQFPMGYRVQALVEAGCSPSQAVDYLAERFENESRGSWESARDADDSMVRENVRAARDALNS